MNTIPCSIEYWTFLFSDITVKKNQLIDTIATIDKEYEVAFDFYPIEFSRKSQTSGKSNLIHFTVDGEKNRGNPGVPSKWRNCGNGKYCVHGGSIPAVSVDSAQYGWATRTSHIERRLYITSDLDINSQGHEYYFHQTPTIPVRQWASIKISQTKNAKGQYIFEVRVNGKTTESVVNPIPRVYHNVKVFASNPWYHPAEGYIRNFYYGGR